jgi:hypothetical protein
MSEPRSQIVERLKNLINAQSWSENLAQYSLSRWTTADLVEVKNSKDKAFGFHCTSKWLSRLNYCKAIARSELAKRTESCKATIRILDSQTRQDKKAQPGSVFQQATNSKKETLSRLYELVSATKQWSPNLANAIVDSANPLQLAHIVGAKRKDFDSVNDTTWKRITECLSRANERCYGRKPQAAEKNKSADKPQPPSCPKTPLPPPRPVSTEFNISLSNCQKCGQYLIEFCWSKSKSNSDRVPGSAKKICNRCYSGLSKPDRRGYRKFEYSQASARNVSSGQTRKQQ